MAIAFYETLPDGCPEADAKPVNNQRFYRFIQAIPAVENDFISHRKRFPKRFFQVSECEACSISLFKISTSLEIEKLPYFRNKIRAIITLGFNDGPVKLTGQNEHYSWWRDITFKIGNNITY